MSVFNNEGGSFPPSIDDLLIEQATELGIELPASMLPPVVEYNEIDKITEEDINNLLKSNLNLDNIEEIEIVDDNLYYEDYITNINFDRDLTSINLTEKEILLKYLDNNKLKHLSLLLEVLDEHYENTYDIKFNSYFTSVILYIYYKDITITNSLNHHHNIKSLFVEITLEFSISKKLFYFQNLKGARFNLTLDEYISQYRHSHLSRTDELGQFDYFCIGNGIYNIYAKSNENGKINYIGILNEDSNKKVTIDDLKISMKSFFISIDNYVKWESTEGGPYIRMNSIGSKETEEIKINSSKIFNYSRYVDYTLENYKNVLNLEIFIINYIDIKYEEERLKELESNDIFNIIENIPDEITKTLPRSVLCYYDNGKFYKFKNNIKPYKPIRETNFIFKNRKVNHIIKSNEIEKIDNLIVNPNVIHGIILKYLDFLINNI